MTPTWEIYDAAAPLAAHQWGKPSVRMLVVGLGEGELLVVSPLRKLPEESWAQLESWGRVRWLLAPNAFHNLGLEPWQARFPDARIVAHPRALPRLRKRLPQLQFGELDELRARLPSHVRLLEPPGAKQGETWLAVDDPTTRSWFVADSFVNESKLPGALGLFMRVMGFRTGLIANPFFMRFFTPDKAAYARWLEGEFEARPPQRFIPSHGALVEGDTLVDQLRSALAKRL